MTRKRPISKTCGVHLTVRPQAHYDAALQQYQTTYFHLERDAVKSVMRRCNHCNGQLGLIIHREWRLRFCSKACKEAYEQKLDEERAKLRHLAFLAQGAQTNYWAEPLEYPQKT
jgi:hypothetical protein